MLDIAWGLFIAASLLVIVTPGQDMVLVMSRSIAQGAAAGVASAAGVSVGLVGHTLLATLGLGAILRASPWLFVVLKFVGAAYLVWLGVQQWRAPARPLAEVQASAAAVTVWAMIRRGWMINAVNPKGTVFLLAVVPQFLDLAQPLAPQYAVIGITLAFTDLVVMAGYTALAARVLSALRSAAHVRVMNRMFGSLFVLREA